MPTRNMVSVRKWGDYKVVLCLNISGDKAVPCSLSLPEAHQRRLFLFFSWEHQTTGEQQEMTAVFFAVLLSKPAETPGEVGRSEPSLPLCSRKAGPLCCKGNSQWRLLPRCGKSKMSLVGSLCSPAWKLLGWEFWPCPSTGSCGHGEANAFLLYVQKRDVSMYQCSAYTGCDCCCTSRSTAGAWLN